MQHCREQSEPESEFPYNSIRMKAQTVTKCSLILQPLSSIISDFQSQSPITTADNDVSFQMEIHKENVQIIKSATIKYLEQCLISDFNSNDGFKDMSLYKLKPFEMNSENQLDTIIHHNQLLDFEVRTEMDFILRKETGLIGLLTLIPEKFGVTVAKQLTFIIHRLLREKLEKYRQLMQIYEPIIPKFNCFQDCQDQQLTILNNNCPIFEELNLQQIINFAEKETEQLSNRLYFSDIKILNLREVNCDLNPNVNHISKFYKLIKQISKSIFLTIAGATDPHQEGTLFDLSREISFADFSQVGHVSIQRTLSRPFVPLEDQQSYDFVSKKIKFQ